MANTVKTAKPAKDDNIAARLNAVHNEVTELGRQAYLGKGAKTRAIEKFRDLCIEGILSADTVDTYVTWYDEGAKLAGGARASFRSALASFANPKVIAAYPTFSAALNKLHAAKDKAVSRKETDKDKFAQMYGIATKIAGMSAAPAAKDMDDAWIKAAVARKTKSIDEVATVAKKAIIDATKTLVGDKPTAQQLAAIAEFCKTLGIDVPAELKPVALTVVPTPKKTAAKK